MTTRDRREDRASAAVAALILLLVVTALVIGGVAVLGGTTPDAPDTPREPTATTATPPPPDERTLNYAFQKPHAAGVTGENVTVGVIDVTGFDLDYPGIAPSVRAARSFDPDDDIANDGYNAHGTRAAEIAVTAAPGADLYLASFDAPDGFARAMAWMDREGVDVVVTPVSFYGRADDGNSTVARAARRATANGTVVVAPVGNLGRGHWEGAYGTGSADVAATQYATDDGATLRFDDGAATNRLTPVGDTGERLVLWVSWDRAHRDETYEVVLYRETAAGPERVATSSPYRADSVPNQRIVRRLDEGQYFFVVRGPTSATGARIELSSPTHEFEHARATGSVTAPATAESVVAVGAYDDARAGAATFSSRGPTAHGRIGVDVVAPATLWTSANASFTGSSAAAPYVAGIAALVVDVDPTLPPSAVEQRLETTAADVGPPGFDYATGEGRVRPWRAVRVAAADRGLTLDVDDPGDVPTVDESGVTVSGDRGTPTVEDRVTTSIDGPGNQSTTGG